MLITISGQSGSGKSTAARMLARRLGAPTVDIGTIFRGLAKKHGLDVIAFGRYAEKHPEVDRELDAAMVARARRGKKLILQGRLAGWMSRRHELPAFRIWIAASARTRAGRVAGREGLTLNQAYRQVTRRDAENRARYRRTYGLDLNDLSIYDAVIQTDRLAKVEVVAALISCLPPVWLKTSKKTITKRKMTSRPQPRPRPKR